MYEHVTRHEVVKSLGGKNFIPYSTITFINLFLLLPLPTTRYNMSGHKSTSC